MAQELPPFYPLHVTTAQRDALTVLMPGLTVFNIETMRWEMWDGIQWTAHMTDASGLTIFDAIVDGSFASEGPVLFQTLMRAVQDGDAESVFCREPGDTAALDLISSLSVRRIQGTAGDTTPLPMNLTISKDDVVLEQLGFAAVDLLLSSARSGARDCLFSGTGRLLTDSGMSYSAVEFARFMGCTATPVVLGGGVGLLLSRPSFLNNSGHACSIDTSAAMSYLSIANGLFLSAGSDYHIKTGALTWTQCTINGAAVLMNANGGFQIHGSQNAIRNVDFLGLAALGGAKRGLLLSSPTGVDIESKVDGCSFIAANAADVMFECSSLDADAAGLELVNCAAPNGGTFYGSQGMRWTSLDLRGCTVNFRSKTGQVVHGGDWTGATLQNVPSDLVIHDCVGQADRPALKVSKSIMFHSPDEDLAVEDWLSDQAVRVPAASKHGTWTPGTVYVRVGTAGTGTNTILFRTSTTLTGARTTRATVNLDTAREASATITWTPADGEYMWVEVSAVGGPAPKKGLAQVNLEEAIYA